MKWLAGTLLLAIAIIVGVAAGSRPGVNRAPGVASSARVVSLAPSLTEIVQALGRGESLVGVSAFCDGVPADVPRVGTLLQPNLEAIVDLRPDLILGIHSDTQRSTFARLEARGIRVLRFGGDRIADAREAVRVLGQEFDAEPASEEILQRLDQTLRSAPDPQGPRVLFVIGRSPIYAAGPGSFVHEMILAAGGRNALPYLSNTQQWPTVDLERILTHPPDLIIDNTLGADHDAEILAAWRTFALRIPAVAAGRVYSFPAVRAGVQIPQWVDQLRSLLK